jgi:hypothetical protein
MDEIFEIETLQDWQMTAGAELVEVEVGGCNSNSTNNS